MQTKKMRMKKKVMKFLFFPPLRKSKRKKTSVAKLTSKLPTKKLSKGVQKTKDITKNLSAVSYF
jgi:hypothetical protein